MEQIKNPGRSDRGSRWSSCKLIGDAFALGAATAVASSFTEEPFAAAAQINDQHQILLHDDDSGKAL